MKHTKYLRCAYCGKKIHFLSKMYISKGDENDNEEYIYYCSKDCAEKGNLVNLQKHIRHDQEQWYL